MLAACATPSPDDLKAMLDEHAAQQMAAYKKTLPTRPTLSAPKPWWNAFNDQALNKWIETALKNNADILTAQARLDASNQADLSETTMEMATANQVAAENTLRIARQTVIREIVTAYADVQLAKYKTEGFILNDHLAKQLSSITERRLNAGLANNSDLRLVKSSEDDNHLDINSSRQDQAQALNHLSQFIGVDTETLPLTDDASAFFAVANHLPPVETNNIHMHHPSIKVAQQLKQAASKSEQSIYVAAYNKTLIELRTGARIAVEDWQASEKQLQLAQAALNARINERLATERLIKSGLLSQAKLIEVQMQESKAHLVLINAQYARISAFAALQFALAED